ncbi:hypothetical protein [Thalassotalea litorea]|uniref:hypothetical protein n=1 Tax=Thalassotalea litorea TaxID=2020715 RepID=UPI0037353CD8
MDLFLANMIVIVFVAVFISIVEKCEIISAKNSWIQAIVVVLIVLITWLASSFLFALLIGWLLPDFYPKVFFYKAIFVTLFLFMYWPYKMFKAQIKMTLTEK